MDGLISKNILLLNSKAEELYSKLDKETEALTEYYKKTEHVFVSIKNREKLKQKLQQNSSNSNF